MSRESRSLLGSLAWSGVGIVGASGVQLGVAVVLARLLTPEDFGLVAMVMVFSGLASLLSEMGLRDAVVQSPQELDQRQLSSVFWLTMMLSTAVWAVLLLCAHPLAAFFEEPALVAVVPVLSLAFLFSGAGAVHLARLNRAMRFRDIAAIETGGAVLGGVAGVAVALLGHRYWALVAQTVVQTGATTLLLWWVDGFRPQLVLELSGIRDRVAYGLNASGARFSHYLMRNSDNLLIGKLLGSTSLGIYQQGYRLMQMPMQKARDMVSRVMFPALSSIQDDHAAVRDTWTRANALLALVAAPSMLGLAAVAAPLVAVLLGPKWIEVGPVLAGLCVAGAIHPNAATAGWLFTSQGRTDLQFRWSLATGALTVAGFVVGLRWGLAGVVWSYVVTSWLIIPPQMQLSSRLVGGSALDFLRAVWRPFVIAVPMAVAVRMLVAQLSGRPAWALLGAGVAAGILLFVPPALLLCRPELRLVLDTFRAAARRAHPAPD